jgi:prolyl-tRNA synthetase
MERTRMMLDIYARLAEEYLALPVTKGRKTAAERFPGAVETFCIEAMMQDRKALQAGTSHFLGQNFAKASGIKFQSFEEKEEYAWTVSWGASTRMIGGIIMMHGDDDGVILPPRVASSQVVFIPIYRAPDDRPKIMEYIDKITAELKNVSYCNRNIRFEIDDRDTGGARGWDWIKKGIPLRIEIGPRDMAQDSVYVARRDKPHREKFSMKREAFIKEISGILDEIQNNLYQKAVSFKEKNTVPVDGGKAFYEFFTPLNREQPEIHGGFALSHWCGTGECEAKIKEDLSVTIRCIPLEQKKENGKCVCCGRQSNGRVVFAKAY